LRLVAIWARVEDDFETMNSVGERIKARRLELGWTQEELCRKANISTGFLSDVENGKRSIGAETLLDIARVLSLSLDYLMTGDPSQVQTTQVEFPARLAELAKNENITFVKALTVLDMKRQIVAHRRDHEDLEEFDWKKFYESVKEFL
jgi:transcriptional regulator with XRE-family HTH domain